ncbi:FAD-dependent oxidoreductase [Winogradskya consettensis]|uniref:Pyridine nucleotide-disulfide oxidoreductase n=1 Tax=Winogradskya consettensis TaxID=113560 RepID=A0A919T0S7_9ACTN|nr:FAD/NAD(P)-binding oxidoreductase [Actinoplanes consettensis]GIM82132.1 pyridine nucleotide-disulfide oxidoreductase [Actinoplanes consettensis]
MTDATPDRHVVIVGASLAGTRTAQGLRTLGHTGRVTLIGAESGLPYDRPPLSKALLTSDWTPSAIDEVRLVAATELEDLAIEYRSGTAAIGLDTAAKLVRLADGSEVGYDVLVIATGAAARPSPWDPGSGVHQLRTLDDARMIAGRLALKEPVVVVGGGFIGTEIAAAAVHYGCPVVVVDPVPEPMARLVGPEIAGSLVGLHLRNGVQTRFGAGVVGIEGRAGDLRVELSTGEHLEASTAVVGIGSVPATAWLAGSGLTLDNGVVTDEFLRAVGAADVYAIGDVARWPHAGRAQAVRAEHWTNAGDQARYVATAIARGTAAAYASSDYVWSDQYDWKVNAVGWRDPRGTSVVVGDLEESGRTAVVHLDAEGAACGVVTVNWVRALNQARRRLLAGEPGTVIVGALRQLL